MKKFVAMLAVMLTLVCVFGAVQAATATKEDVIAAAKAAVPEKYEYEYLVQLETVLNAVNPSGEVCGELVGIIREVKGQITTDKGGSLEAYTKAEQDIIMGAVDEAAGLLGVTYEVEAKASAVHEGDDKVVIYYNGQKITEVDGDIAKTGADVPATSAVMPIALTVVALAAAAAFVFGKKVIA